MVFLAFALITNLFAHNIHQAECIVPRNKPNAQVGAIYLHGWFEFSGTDGFYNTLELRNRQKLQEVADRTGRAIAVPLSGASHYSSEKRSWLAEPPDQRPSTATKMKNIEAKAEAACRGRTWEQGVRIMGFSDGGYMAREIALECAAKAPKYSAVLMSGAQARVAARPSGPNCAKLYAVRGVDDRSTNTCVRREGRRCVASMPFSQVARGMVNGFRNAELMQPYPGSHVLPPVNVLSSLFPQVKAEVIQPAPVSKTGIPSGPVKAPPVLPPDWADKFSFGTR